MYNTQRNVSYELEIRGSAISVTLVLKSPQGILTKRSSSYSPQARNKHHGKEQNGSGFSRCQRKAVLEKLFFWIKAQQLSRLFPEMNYVRRIFYGFHSQSKRNWWENCSVSLTRHGRDILLEIFNSQLKFSSSGTTDPAVSSSHRTKERRQAFHVWVSAELPVKNALLSNPNIHHTQRAVALTRRLSPPVERRLWCRFFWTVRIVCWSNTDRKSFVGVLISMCVCVCVCVYEDRLKIDWLEDRKVFSQVQIVHVLTRTSQVHLALPGSTFYPQKNWIFVLMSTTVLKKYHI